MTSNKGCSRLDRLFILLENGTTLTTRKAAARQLGGVQKKHPHELNHLLARLMTYIQHKEWDTRIAGAEAVKAVVSEVPLWSPLPIKQENKSAMRRNISRLKFSEIDINKIMNGAQLLLSSSGVEFESLEDEGLDSREKVIRARHNLEKKLGLTVGGGKSLGVSSNDLFGDEDLISRPVKDESQGKSTVTKKVKPKKPCVDVVAQLTEGMSNRERNRAKRKARLLMKQNSTDSSMDNDGQPPKKREKTEKYENSGQDENMYLKKAPKHEPLPEMWEEWPFEWICEELLNLLFSPIWEWRHGACLALRDILNMHGSGAGVVRGDTLDEMRLNNGAWLEDAAIRMLCVMVLDRFGDFVSDQVVAPVRESCAQALGVLTRHLNIETISELLKVLLHLTQVEEWEVRHGGFLGVKYMLAVREDLHKEIVGRCVGSLIRGLCDRDGDAKSVSAEALLPITKHLVEDKDTHEQLRSLVQVLCNSLNELDELTASTQSILTLLSKLVGTMSFEDISSFMNIQGTMSRLWPFTQHSIPAVRRASLVTLETLLNSIKDQSKVQWFDMLANDGLWSLFQCCILEEYVDIQDLAVKVWKKFLANLSQLALCAICQQHFATWFMMTSQPHSVPFSQNVLMPTAGQNRNLEEGDVEGALKYIGGNPGRQKNSDSEETREESVMRTRKQASKMLGILCGLTFVQGDHSSHPLIAQTGHTVIHQLINFVNSRFAIQRVVASMILSNWWKSKSSMPPNELYAAVLHILSEDLYFNEISSLFIQVQSEIKSIFLMASKQLKEPLSFALKQVYSLEDALALCGELDARLSDNDTELKDASQRLYHIANQAQQDHICLQRMVRSYVAHCLITASYRSSDEAISISRIAKLNPIIQPLMEGMKKEKNQVTRGAIAQALTYLVDLCSTREPCPNSKILRNLCDSLRGDATTFPDLLDPAAAFSSEVLEQVKCTREDAAKSSILTLLQKHALLSAQNSERRRRILNMSPPSVQSDESKEKPMVTREGALSCMRTLCEHFQEKLFVVLPQLWNIISSPHSSSNTTPTPETNGGSVNAIPQNPDSLNDKMLSLLVLEALSEKINEDIAKQKIFELLPEMLKLIWSEYSAVRYMCSRCLSAFTKRFSSDVMTLFIEKFLPSIDATEDLYKRMGTVEMVANIIKHLKTSVLPYTVLLIVPLLGRMSDQNPQVRLVATQCFASLIQYLPIESSVPNPPNMPSSLMSKRKSERRFLEQLLDSSSLDEYEVPVPINAKLRKYQEDGVKWMAFLNRYKLHGILCDDMGLGKTLQSICILASDYYYNQKKLEKGGSVAPLPSLVICPPTLTGHWIEEVMKFCSKEYLNPLHYAGQPVERMKLQRHLKYHNLVVASYEVVRNDITFFRGVSWNYCILDEGQMIRNGKSKLTVCIKSIKCKHRLILTGTPIQNSVLELWSLFDFLMPGFLGSEQEFNARYSKPILASRDAKSSSKEQEEGVMAMERLHRQVLPFMLRRMKEDVLQDLPPKIIQDYYCDLSPLQVRLYEDFAKTKAKKEVESSITHADLEQNQVTRSKQTSHVFQALQYLQKVCNHPALVLTQCHPEYRQVTDQLAKENSSLHDIQHSSKLVALKQLLLDCGIGTNDSSSSSLENVVSQHRALIFCQHKSMLDVVEYDLLRKHMKSVTFLRLDGSIAANSRHGIVSQFNNDPSIDLLLLTTKVGGLGLNLTGADTVIFIEHDWNPTVDLQAMDRAHRIGQKRVVNVYRLITRATLEEKILGLQQFKMNIANTVISTENSSLQSMGTNQLLDLFTINKGEEKKKGKEGGGRGLRALMDEIGELWDQNQYDTEYNLDNFMESLVT